MGQKIIVIEDDPVDAGIIERALEKCCPTHVVRATTAGYAVNAIKAAGPDYFAAVFLDLMLPGGPGTEVIRAIRRSGSLVPIVVVTGSRQEADIYACYRLGANAFMVKPADPVELERDVEAAAWFWLKLNRLPKQLPPVAG